MSFDGTDIAAVITAIGGVATGIITHRRGKKTESKTQKKSASDHMQDTYAGLVEDLREELVAMTDHYRGELKNLTNQLQFEREQWMVEKHMWEQEIKRLRGERGGE